MSTIHFVFLQILSVKVDNVTDTIGHLKLNGGRIIFLETHIFSGSNVYSFNFGVTMVNLNMKLNFPSLKEPRVIFHNNPRDAEMKSLIEMCTPGLQLE